MIDDFSVDNSKDSKDSSSNELLNTAVLKELLKILDDEGYIFISAIDTSLCKFKTCTNVAFSKKYNYIR